LSIDVTYEYSYVTSIGDNDSHKRDMNMLSIWIISKKNHID